MKKVISLLLALVMALSLLPAAVWAEGEDAAAPAEEVSESFFDSSHPFTWNDGSYVWRFWWNGPDGSWGEWHLYAAPEHVRRQRGRLDGLRRGGHALRASNGGHAGIRGGLRHAVGISGA